jgi:hypothetical protein
VAREQRKLAAILAADVVGYSRLMGRDASSTLARLAAISSRICSGLILRSGSGCIALFSRARVPILYGARQRPMSALYSQAIINAGASE